MSIDEFKKPSTTKAKVKKVAIIAIGSIGAIAVVAVGLACGHNMLHKMAFRKYQNSITKGIAYDDALRDAGVEDDAEYHKNPHWREAWTMGRIYGYAYDSKREITKLIKE